MEKQKILDQIKGGLIVSCQALEHEPLYTKEGGIMPLMAKAAAQILLKEDGKVFAIWWLAVLLLGWCSFPLCQYLFSGFRDKGYLVAKIFGIASAGFLMWLGAATGIVPFTAGSCLGSVAVFAVICWGVWITLNKNYVEKG